MPSIKYAEKKIVIVVKNVINNEEKKAKEYANKSFEIDGSLLDVQISMGMIKYLTVLALICVSI